ncbi:MAG TPA: hypothetical protein VFC01_36185 [Mycobacterium sp.]|nr:hypothetical protein [Mycobacterium sp.]
MTMESVELRETDEITERGARVYLVTVTLMNVSDHPVYAASIITYIRYADADRTLHIGFGTRNDADWPFLSPPRPTPHVEIASGAHIAIEDSIVSPIEYVEETADGAVQARTIAIDRDVAEIQCTVSFADEPPPMVIDLTSSTPTRDIARHVVRGTWVRPD